MARLSNENFVSNFSFSRVHLALQIKRALGNRLSAAAKPNRIFQIENIGFAADPMRTVVARRPIFRTEWRVAS